MPSEPKSGHEVEINITAPAESLSAALKPGDTGEAISTLRPAGRAKFADAVVDVVAEADFIGAGSSIVVTEIHGNRVVVRGQDA